ncbi:MAG: hypothetical protein APF84_09595 [Gracilibacter sp. BRH_c7a]|nr:MAG: hypothetical protein APF84_09595 [Gracilibacter sp. BRH_c7a]
MNLQENLMLQGAAKLIKECAGVSSEDIVLIVCDYQSFLVANQICRACLAVGSNTNMVVIQPTAGHGIEPPELVGAAMQKTTVVFAVTSKSMSHTEAVKQARAKGSRIITMPEFLPEMLISGAIEANFTEQRLVAEKVKDLLTIANTAVLTSEDGTNLTFDLSGRNGRAVHGIAKEPGTFAAPPNIEASIAPLEGKAEGILVVNASIAGIGLLSSPVKLEISAGKAISISGGGDAQTLRSIIEEANDEKVYMVAELGIGLNPKACMRGSLLEDEAVLGSVHVALGSNASFGGTIQTKRHIDLISLGATLELDEKVIIQKGKLIV